MKMFHLSVKSKWLPGLLTALGCVCACASFAKEPECRLVVGYNPGPPYYAPDGTGKVVGIDVNILRSVTSELGCQLEFWVLPWKRTLAMLKAGEIDVTMSASYKMERADFAHYSETYRGQPHYIFVRKDGEYDVSDLKPFLNAGYSLGVVDGWHYTTHIQSYLQDPKYKKQVQVASKIENVIQMLGNERFDGFLANPAQVLAVVGEEQFKTSYRMIRADIDRLHYIFSKKRVSADFMAKFNSVLEAKLRAGIFAKVCSEFEDQLISTCEDLAVYEENW